ncbi:hypothetical protein [Rickettsia endosymbiont of Polydrusus tereticollis]|uniref:hypothetical protein n=1 Tax=Rickettsia endosymbiont of Polydrusus tereticollis TaxID=3066251 RepID=UPI0031334308
MTYSTFFRSMQQRCRSHGMTEFYLFNLNVRKTTGSSHGMTATSYPQALPL